MLLETLIFKPTSAAYLGVIYNRDVICVTEIGNSVTINRKARCGFIFSLEQSAAVTSDDAE